MSTLMILTVNGKAISILWKKYAMMQLASLIDGISEAQANELHTTGETVGEFGKVALEIYEPGRAFDQYKGVKIDLDTYVEPF